MWRKTDGTLTCFELRFVFYHYCKWYSFIVRVLKRNSLKVWTIYCSQVSFTIAFWGCAGIYVFFCCLPLIYVVCVCVSGCVRASGWAYLCLLGNIARSEMAIFSDHLKPSCSKQKFPNCVSFGPNCLSEKYRSF